MHDVDAYPKFCVQLLATSSPAPATVRWQLVDDTGRICGYGPDGYVDGALCRGAVLRLQRDIVLHDRRVRRVDVDRWVWEVRAAGSPAAVSARLFGDRDSCELAMMLFVLNFGTAPVGRQVSTVRHFGLPAAPR